MLAAAYTMNGGLYCSPFFPFIGKPGAHKPREFEGGALSLPYAANLSAKNIMIWL